MDDQRFIYDSEGASAAVARAADVARQRADLTVVDVSDSHDPRDVIEAYRSMLDGAPGPFEQKLDRVGDADPTDGIFVGRVDGQRTVLVGEEALRAIK